MFQLQSFVPYPIAVDHQDGYGSVFRSVNFRLCKDLPLSFLLKVNRSQLSQPLPISRVLRSLTIFGFSAGFAPVCLYLSCTGEPQTLNSSLDAAPRELKRGEKLHPCTCWLKSYSCCYTLLPSVFLANQLYLLLWTDYSSVEEIT